MNSNMEKMVKLVSVKLGISEEKLKQWLEKDDVESMMSNMRREDADKLKKLMDNPSVRDKLMKSPEAESLMNKIND